MDDDEWLKTGWIEEEDEEGPAAEEGRFIQTYVESKTDDWTADQVWGFEMIEGKRYHTRHVLVRNKDDWKLARFVYDYHG